MQLITVPPEVESLVICPLTVSSMFFVAIRSPEPSVPWHWDVTQGLHPCWRCKGTVYFSAMSTFKRPPEVLGLWPRPSSKSGLSSNFRVGNAYGNLTLTSPCLGDRGSGSGRVDASLLNFLCGRRGTGSVLLTEDQGAPFSVFLWWRLFPFLGKDFFRPYRSYLYLFPTLPPTMSTCIKYLEMPKIKISLYPRMTFYDSFSSTDRWDYSKHGKLKVLPWRSPLQVVSHSKINIVEILQLISSLVYDGDQQVLIHSQVNTIMSTTVFQCFVALLFMREYDLNSLLLFHCLKYFQFFWD